MSQPNRLPHFDKFDKARPLNFIFNGRHLQGYQGDTLASALIANGIKLIGRSFKYHRPRGVMGSGSEETNALVQLEPQTPSTLANIQATKVELYEGLKAKSVNCWPNPEWDILSILSIFHRILPAGFYYKTFMWPQKAWRFYEYFIRKAAGLGQSPSTHDPDYYDKINISCDVLVIGGGPSGLSAALASSDAGATTILVDEQPSLGGQLLNEHQDQSDGVTLEWLNKIKSELAKISSLKILTRTTAFGSYDQNFVSLLETRRHDLKKAEEKSRQRIWHVRAKQIILATGAIERPLVFSNNDRPGIMLASAYRAYINRYGVCPGREIVVFTNNDDAYRTAIDLKNAGINVPAIVDIRADPDGELPTLASELNIEILDNMVISRVIGSTSVKAIQVMSLDPKGEVLIGNSIEIKCDGIASSGGWNPIIHLQSQLGGKPTFNQERGIFLGEESTGFSTLTGAANGTLYFSECIREGSKTGTQSAKKCGFSPAKRTRFPKRREFFESPIKPFFSIPDQTPADSTGKHFVDLQNDVTTDDINLAAREGYQSIEHAKRYTTLGMATDQGKTGNVPGMAILARAVGQDNLGVVGTTTFRPPYTPVTIGALAGNTVGSLFVPTRRTPMHTWHEQSRCEWEDVGEWKRPWYYPKPGETKQEALNRETYNARNSIGILDASTLGKIDIQGKDASKFLDMIYTNSWKNLKVGTCRYGVMLKEDGMIMDDGVTACLGKNHYLMTTTTGNASLVLSWLEEWLQTEWPELDVFCNSVTEQWATISLCGKNSRDLLTEFPGTFDFSPDAFRFMSFKTGQIAGIPARIFRISFSGELSFEINTPSNYGLALWTLLINAGEKYGITPYGTETMHILRAEKGYFIVGQETDGTVTPVDLGLDWMISPDKDFIGKRSLSRADTSRLDRKQLVGIIPEKLDEVADEGSQIIESSNITVPMEMIGHVTSSYYSANLKRSIALGLIKNGRKRHGDQIYLFSHGKLLKAEITSPKFFDPQGARQNG